MGFSGLAGGGPRRCVRCRGFHFVNKTTEAHEMTFFETPTGVTLAQAKTALEIIAG